VSRPRAPSAHIGCLFSDLVDRRQLSFLAGSPIRKIKNIAPEFNRDTAPRRSRSAGQSLFVFSQKEI
jgi:hypothetical protein